MPLRATLQLRLGAEGCACDRRSGMDGCICDLKDLPGVLNPSSQPE
jgi:hypothetical protein